MAAEPQKVELNQGREIGSHIAVGEAIFRLTFRASLWNTDCYLNDEDKTEIWRSSVVSRVRGTEAGALVICQIKETFSSQKWF